LAISNHNSFRVLFGKISSVYIIRKYTYILALEMASPRNQHCANCIGTLSFPISRSCVFNVAMQQSKRLSATMLTEVAKYNCRYSLRSASTTFDSTRWKAARPKSSSRLHAAAAGNNELLCKPPSQCPSLASTRRPPVSLTCNFATYNSIRKRHAVSIATSKSRVSYWRWPHSMRR